LRGVSQIFADTGEYHVNPQPDSRILMRGPVLAGTTPDSPPEATGKNNPMQPLVWYRIHKNEAGAINKAFCTTMGSATDLRDESLRRLLVNAVYWGFGMEIPARADVQLVGDFQPTPYGFDGFRRGVKPDDDAMPATSR
jgi:hypothetical protein